MFFIKQTVKSTFHRINSNKWQPVHSRERLCNVDVLGCLVIILHFSLKLTTLLLNIKLTPMKVHALVVEEFM